MRSTEPNGGSHGGFISPRPRVTSADLSAVTATSALPGETRSRSTQAHRGRAFHSRAWEPEGYIRSVPLWFRFCTCASCYPVATVFFFFALSAVLVEKERTVPDSYPLTLNALVAGCNQKSSRDPVLNASETDVQAGVDGLKSMLLVIERSGGRVARYAHNVERMMNVPQQAAALLAVLMLRGPQTAGELRINCERLHRFADIPGVEALLNELAERPEGALVAELPRQPGSRENRWMHLLSGAPPVPSSSEVDLSAESPSPGISELAAVKANVARLEAELREVKDLLAKVCAQLGIE